VSKCIYEVIRPEAAPGVRVRNAGELPVSGLRCGIQAEGLAESALQGQEAQYQIFVLD